MPWRPLIAASPAELVARMSALRGEDFGLDLAARMPARAWDKHLCHRDPACEIGLFFLPAGERIPLHDHPGMHVYMRVLVGALHVTSFTWDGPPFARRTGDAVLDPGAPVWVVEPRRDNLHSLHARRDVVFLDVLRPPYGDRPCTYYSAAPADGGRWRLQARP
jgi:hypothetical protein